MDIEIVEFYPIKEEESGNFTGSLHVYIIGLDVDLRGIFVSYDKTRDKHWRFYFPRSKSIDKDTKLEVFYPVFQFANHEHTRELMRQIRFRGKPYIQKNYLGLDVKEPPKAERKSHGFSKSKPKVEEPKDLWNRRKSV